MKRQRAEALPPTHSSRLRSVRRILGMMAVAVLAVLIGPAPSAWAHGEDSQQAFERTATVTFYDVKFSDTDLNINDEVTITGNVRVMNAWPDHTIGEPEIGFLNILAPGPVFYVQERWMSGMFTPQSVKVEKGATYPFKIVAKARIPGTHHIHPSLAMEGSGTLVGRGEYITIHDAGGPFTQPLQLAAGGTVDLADNYGMGRVTFFTLLGLVVGAGYLAFWLRKPLLQRGHEVVEGRAGSLITKQERKVSVGFAVVALLIGVIGYAYAELATGPMIPLQVARVQPEPLAPSALQTSLDAKVDAATFQDQTGALVVDVTVHNTSPNPVQMSMLQFADYEVLNPAVHQGPVPDNAQVGTFAPNNTIAPGATQKISVSMDGKELVKRNLVPLDEAQARLTGLMFFQDATGANAVSEVNELTSGIIPQY